jgi:O-antigen/teichoic acid export membrane protein
LIEEERRTHRVGAGVFGTRAHGGAREDAGSSGNCHPGENSDVREHPGGHIGREVRVLTTASALYLLPPLVSRGLSVLLLPVYTRAMPPEEYGIVGVASVVGTVITTVLALGLTSAVGRLHWEFRNEDERSRFYGTAILLQLGWALAGTVVVWVVGLAGGLDRLFVSMRFRPHLELVLLSSFFAVFPNLGLTMLMMRERTRAASLYSVATSLVQLVSSIVFVVVLRRGAVGQLEANVLASIVQTGISAWVVRSYTRLSFSFDYARRALAFGVPLVPHMVSNWALAVSDRWVLERFVDGAELGRYTVGYTIGSVGGMLYTAIAQALYPIVNRKLSAGEERDVPPLGTYSLLLVVACGLPLALFAHEALTLLTPAEYHGASEVVPWVVLGFVFQHLYRLWSHGTFFAKKTAWIPVVTIVAAALNLGLNLLTVPRFGILAAAVNTAGGYGALALLQGVLAQMTRPIAWEYGQWVRLLAIGAGCFVLGVAGAPASLGGAIVVKTILVLVIFPALLLLTGAIRADQVRRALRWVARRVGIAA